ncbi:MAG: hypothetical protein JJT89_01515 [Nitriliruptoraceae bacterium]|nr:hypothetical protein [Nitriliruptoraceae bacterium]
MTDHHARPEGEPDHDPIAAAAHRAADAVRDRASSRRTVGVSRVMQRARRRERTPAIVAASLVVLLAVPGLVWVLQDDGGLQISDVEVADRTDPVEPSTDDDGTGEPDEGDDTATDPAEDLDEVPADGETDGDSDATEPDEGDDDGTTSEGEGDGAGGSTAADEPAVDPIGPTVDTDTKQTPGFPDGGGEPLALTDIRLAGQSGFDRLVLEFDGDQMSPYRVAYIDPPILEDGSGNTVTVEGEAFLEVRLTAASGVVFDLDEEDGFRLSYEGPTRLRAQTAVVTEVVRTGDFEATLTVVIGLERRVPFAVDTLDGPNRLVVDLSHGG